MKIKSKLICLLVLTIAITFSGNFSNFYGYSSNPSYSYIYRENANITYTFCITYTFTAGQTVIFTTEKSDTYSDVDTELFLFYRDNPDIASWYNDDYSGYYSRISVTIPVSGSYLLFARNYSGSSVKYAKILKDGIVVDSNAKLGGYTIYDNSINKTGTLNFFTANSSVDTRLFVLDSSKRVIGYNDDYSGTGDYSWGRLSRVRKSFTISPSYVFVCSYSANDSGSADIYAKCSDGYYNTSDFPKLKQNDSIMADTNTLIYNCIAWSGGITDTWINPDFTLPTSALSPWYNKNNTTAFDNFYGNKPLRYNGAVTYTFTSLASESIIDIYTDGASKWLHAAVRKPSNNMPHGYAWESKVGGNQRIFHERSSLTGGIYGVVGDYYKVDTRSIISSGMEDTFESSFASGKTVLQNINIEVNEYNIIQKKLAGLNDNIINEFYEAYDNWKKAVENDENLLLSSNSDEFTKLFEFEKLRKISDKNKKVWYLIISKYIEEQDVFSQTLFNHIIVADNEKTLVLADQIREKNNSISNESYGKDVYIAPSYKTNAINFIKEIINQADIYIE